MIMEKHLVFFDVDGTLSFSNANISDANVKALEKLRAAGHEIFLNTGRSRSIIPKSFTDAVEFDGFVCGSTYVEYHGEVLHRVLVDDDTIRGFCKYALETGMKLLLEGEEKSYGVNRGCYHPCTNITDDMDAYLAEPSEMRVTKMTCDREIPIEVSKRFPKVRCINFGRYSEQIVYGYDKAFGMKLLCDRLSIPYENTAAFGDSINDIEMLKFANKSVIMHSAPPSLDKYAMLRTSLDDGGVSEGIEKIFFGETE